MHTASGLVRDVKPQQGGEEGAGSATYLSLALSPTSRCRVRLSRWPNVHAHVRTNARGEMRDVCACARERWLRAALTARYRFPARPRAPISVRSLPRAALEQRVSNPRLPCGALFREHLISTCPSANKSGLCEFNRRAIWPVYAVRPLVRGITVRAFQMSGAGTVHTGCGSWLVGWLPREERLTPRQISARCGPRRLSVFELVLRK